ncbi:hypothetical protein CC86DRAFT_89545 [Ophiobolus disseminans]|uniref:Secreted protein n=1 Tax=Ophiobolus disseminans TaxID=1469910 RepID=A0A6A7AGK7_9PLEO|nr:hypothetical protein CC86DRAFT_89545 [Ophiobolus disseminans]
MRPNFLTLTLICLRHLRLSLIFTSLPPFFLVELDPLPHNIHLPRSNSFYHVNLPFTAWSPSKSGLARASHSLTDINRAGAAVASFSSPRPRLNYEPLTSFTIEPREHACIASTDSYCLAHPLVCLCIPTSSSVSRPTSTAPYSTTSTTRQSKTTRDYVLEYWRQRRR